MKIYQCPHIEDASQCTELRCYHGEMANTETGVSQIVTVLFDTDFGSFSFQMSPESVQKACILMMMFDQD